MWSGCVFVWSLRDVSTLTGCFFALNICKQNDLSSCPDYQSDLFPWSAAKISMRNRELQQTKETPYERISVTDIIPHENTHETEKKKLSSSLNRELFEARVDFVLLHVWKLNEAYGVSAVSQSKLYDT